MNCEDVKKYIYPLLDNELDTETNLEVLSHLNMCDSCQERLEAEKAFQNKLSDTLSSRSAPDETRQMIQDRLAEARANRSLFRRLQSGVDRVLPAAAALLLCLAAGMVVYTGIYVKSPSSSLDLLNTMPAYHDRLIQSNKDHYLKQVQSGTFLDESRLNKTFGRNLRELKGSGDIPSLEEQQCKILDGGVESDRWNRFGSPFYYVVYCYRPDEQTHHGITHVAVRQPFPEGENVPADAFDRPIQRKGNLRYVRGDGDRGHTVFWGNRTHTFAMMSDEVSVEKLLEFAEVARRKSMQDGKPAKLDSAQGRDF